ncbi:hypothetical protein M427DRAFT_37504 [Gonapodya prolifera JEL478]|uniref:C2H2-type domain-containing protein n=1 Tax=Gonapodya prolifera (strain JEL478) TaxID=1344416 RepID=A0A139A0P2_GONPJ|nr:hypothetical protein M427DRAFT_37504 [Gonapodya prolifera JEL478]|eukprot:KXS10340.1 hypothetical protein M427DRAFT_37504 [Gonapodya prolifera JEL478]
MSAQLPGSFRLAPIEGVPTRAFRCPACGRAFTRRDVMLRHQKRVTCRLNSHVTSDTQPPEREPRQASKRARGRARDGEAAAAGSPVSISSAAYPQHPDVSPSHTSPPNSPSQLSPSSTTPAPPILPRSASMDHRSLPLPVHPALYIPARRESIPLPALNPSHIDDTMRQFAQEFEESASHPAGNYELSSPQHLILIPPRVIPVSQRWASRSPPDASHSSPAFLEPEPIGASGGFH